MQDNYYIDLKSFSLDAYAVELEQAELLPSRKLLQADLQDQFTKIKLQGLNTLGDLLNAIKTPPKLKAFAQKSGVSEEYLTLLKREIGSCLPKAVNLQDFPGMDASVLTRLSLEGIKDTRQLFDFVKTPAERLALSRKTGIVENIILELTQLTDVCRIRWVGANFARLLVDSEFNTVKKVAQADYAVVYRKLMEILDDKHYFKGKFGLNDMKLCVLAAKMVPDVIVYE